MIIRQSNKVKFNSGPTFVCQVIIPVTPNLLPYKLQMTGARDATNGNFDLVD